MHMCKITTLHPRVKSLIYACAIFLCLSILRRALMLNYCKNVRNFHFRCAACIMRERHACLRGSFAEKIKETPGQARIETHFAAVETAAV